MDRYSMSFFPLVMFIGGTVNLYMAVQLMQTYRQEKQIWEILASEGVFEGKTEEHKEDIAEKVKEMMQRMEARDGVTSVQLAQFILDQKKWRSAVVVNAQQDGSG